MGATEMVYDVKKLKEDDQLVTEFEELWFSLATTIRANFIREHIPNWFFKGTDVKP